MRINSATLLLLLLMTLGCQITNDQPITVVTKEFQNIAKKFILLGNNEYEGDLTIALMEKGFSIKPIAITQSVAELESPTKLVEYNQAGFRYALKMSITHNRAMQCVFSGGHIVEVTMMVIDVRSNETLAIIKQSGPDRRCPPLTPVWDLIAEELNAKINGK